MKKRYRSSRVHLPKRSRSAAIPANFDELKNSLSLGASLADRLGSLPGMHCSGAPSGGDNRVRRYYLDCSFLREPIAGDSVLFAELRADGRLLLRIPRAELEEILRSGWGELHGDRIHTFTPRDAGDLTVLWRIILMAYFDVVERRSSDAWREFASRSRNLRAADIGSSRLAPGTFF